MGIPVILGQGGKRGGAAAAVLLAGTVGMLALPSAVLALTARLEQQPLSVVASGGSGTFMPASVDPRLARSITVRALAKGQMFRFTPAATPTRLDRSVTVAVRLDPRGLRPITAKGPVGGGDPASAPGALRIAPTGYNLGVSRGYRDFAGKLGGTAEPRRADIPDLASFKPASPVPGDPSRFSPHIALDGREQAGNSPRTFAGQGEQKVDLGGSYRLTRNINVTAGVRYSSERDRLVPVTDGRQDNQAVYVGTQFRF